MARTTRVPIVLLTGFLGTGKTSNLKRWLRDPEFAGAMVIVNELGEVGLDHQLLAFASDAPLLLDNGCACCQASDDLVAMLERLFFDRLHRKIAPFSWVLIETTGIADPVPIADLLRGSDIVATRYELAGVVSTFDSRQGLEQLRRHPEVRRQIECAAVVVLTKTDVAGPDEIRRAREAIARLNGDARVLASSKGNLGAGELLAALQPPGSKPGHGRGGEGHVHHHAVHSEGITTAFLPMTSKVAWSALSHALSRSLAEHGPAILRLKGVIEIEGASAPQVIQASPPDVVERASLDSKAEDPRLGLTIIAQGIPAADVADSLSSKIAQLSRGPAPAELS
jgi:G3E family GTPase